MSNQAAQSSYVLIRRLADGTIEWIPLESSEQFSVTPGASYTLIDRGTDYEAPQTLVAQRRGDDLVIGANEAEAVVLGGFFAAADVAFYPTTDIAGGAGPFSGSPLTPDSPVLPGSAAGEQVVWSAEQGEADEPVAAAVEGGGGTSPLVWGGLALGGLGLAAAAGGGGGGGGGSAGSSATPSDPNPADSSSPQITSGTIATAIEENSPPGKVVYSATATDANPVTWSLADSGDATAFSIDPDTGAVTLLEDPDFEAQESYTFTVIATDSEGNRSQQTVTLAITDVDENGPRVTSVALTDANGIQNSTLNAGDTATVTVSMSENTIVDTTGGTPRIALSIGGDTVFAEYVSGSGTAALTFGYTVQPGDTDTNGIGIPSNALQLNGGSLEDAAGNAAALDHGSVASNAAFLVDTTAPAITSGTIAPAIDENSGSGQVVYTATAADAGPVTWSLTGADSAAFEINANTGAVTLIGDPNYEAKGSYGFIVVAADGAGNTSQQAVTLAVNDVDEIGPSVTSVALTGATGAQNDTLNAGDTVTVVVTMSENILVDSAGGTPRIALNIGGDKVFADYVSGSGSAALTFRYTVQPDDNDSNGISIDSDSLELNGGILTDAEGNQAFLNHSPLSDNPAFLVDTTAPAITSGALAPAVDENSGADQLVYTATATDAGSVTWGLSGPDAGDFSIDPNSGEVTLDVDPNYEAQNSYDFTVVATDAAGNSSQQAVTLTINNVDETRPTVASVALTGATGIQNSTLNAGDTVTVTVTMSEITVVDTSGGVPRIELDIGGNVVFAEYVSGSGTTDLTFRYTVQAGDTDANGISIPKDALELNGGSLQDAAGNAADLKHSSVPSNPSFLVDTSAPAITSGAIAPAIDENSGAGQVVYDANAIDAGTVTWSLAGPDAEDFTINPATGQVTIDVDPNYEAQNSYSFTVVATDAAGNSNQQAVTLAINDVDEIAPSVTGVALTGATGIQNSTLNAGDTVTVTVNMSENTFVDTTGGTPRIALNIGGDTVFADYVSGSGSTSLTFRYTVQPGDTDTNGISIPTNALQPNGGSLQDAAGNAAVLNHSSVASNPSFLVDTTAPAITSGAVAPAIDENSGADQVVYTATATDTGTVTWGLSGPDAGDFSIDPNSGQVTLDVDPNYEDQNSYNFTVVATDAAGNSSQQSVTLAINDVDEIEPSVVSVALTSATGIQNNTLNAGDTVTVTVTMSENTFVDTTGGTPRVELDIGSDTVFADYVSGSGTTSLNFRYTVQPGDTDTNGIRIPSNALELNGGSLQDAAGNPADLRHGQAGNDPSYLVDTTAPTITSGVTASAIDENSGAGQVVYDANANDAGTVTWSLSGPDAGDFSIDPDNGQVTIDVDPNYEVQNSYTFTVVATDAAGNSSQQEVTLAINDVDEVAAASDGGSSGDTSIVVFDLVQGSSSDHSGRTFQSDVSYDIYIRVDSVDSTLSSAASGSGTWGTWSGATNLGSDDRIVLVGDGSQIQGPAGAVDQVTIDTTAIAWVTTLGFDAGVVQDRSFIRLTGSTTAAVSSIRLFGTSLPASFLGSQGGLVSTMYFTDMPAGILTSQGLV